MTQTHAANNRRIARNTLIMYGRLFIFLIISFYTARIIYKALGIDNFGIYNVVGGIIVFFSFINNGLSTATRRYITAEIGQGDENSRQHVFNISLRAHALVALIIVLLAETVGLWFVNNQLNIPPERMVAANWVYQFSIVAAVFGIFQSLYSATITAYERMSAYAYFTIFDAVSKLVIVLIIDKATSDKLILYALLIALVAVINLLIYNIYCNKVFKLTHLKRVNDKPLLKEIFQFMAWSLFGQGAVALTNQGVSVLVNLFTNVAVNAAMGVSNTITNVVSNFVNNFQIAFNPQIIKSYVTQDYDYLKSLILRTSKLSSYLVLIFLVPLLFECSNVLTLWLGSYPPYAVEFCNLTLVFMWLSAMMAPLSMLVYGDKNIKTYQLVVSAITATNFLFSWVVLAIGLAPYYIVAVKIAVDTLSLVARLYFAKHYLPTFNIGNWLYEVLGKGLVVLAVSALLTWRISENLHVAAFPHIVLLTVASCVICGALILVFGLNKSERTFIFVSAKHLFGKVKPRQA